MGFLKKFFRGVFHEGAQAAPAHSSLEHLSEEQLEAHLGVERYGACRFAAAVRPTYDVKVTGRQGYRHDFCLGEESKRKVLVLMGAAMRETLVVIVVEVIEP